MKRYSVKHLVLHLFLFFLISVILGQLGKIPFSEGIGGLYLSEVVLILLAASWFIWRFIEEKEFSIDWIDWVLGSFTTILFFSLLMSLRWTEPQAFVVGLLYWFRISLYILLFKITHDVIKASPRTIVSLIKQYLVNLTAIFALIGLLQFFIFPDFSQYVQHGWDPHYYRVLSTFFDPNYAGIFLIFGSYVLLFRLYERFSYRDVLLLLIILFALVLTYSRSTYLAFGVGILVFGLLKDLKLVFAFILIALVSFFSVPRLQERVIGAFEIDETAQLRLENYQMTWNVIEDHRYFGVGYNTYRDAQASYGYFRDERGVQTDGGHAGAGADNSFLFTWATSGLMGLISLAVVLLAMVWKFIAHNSTVPLTMSLLAALLAHSQFVNSLFFPWVLGWFLIIISLYLYDTSVNDGKKIS